MSLAHGGYCPSVFMAFGIVCYGHVLVYVKNQIFKYES